MKKITIILLSLLSFNLLSQIATQNKFITKTFTFTASSNTVAYTPNYCINQYTAASQNCYSVDIGVSGTELVNVIGVSSHTAMPSLYITLYSSVVPMPGDNTGAMTQTFSDLSNYFIGAINSNVAWVSAVPKPFLGSWNSVGNMQAPRGAFITGNKLYFIIQSSAGHAASANAQYSLKFIFKY